MSAPLYETRPPMTDSGPPPQTVGPPQPTAGLNVASRLIHLDPGWFSLSLVPGTADRSGLPGVRVCLPPAPPGRRETVSISAMRGDGWMTAHDEPVVMRVAAGGGDVLVTQYWSAADPTESAPALRLVRLNPEGAGEPPPASAVPHGPFAAPPPAEIVAHVEGVGDVDGKLGDWVGMRGSGRAIEGFSLTPRHGIAAEDFEVRAVLGRDWLSPWLPGGSFCGSRGLALPLRGFCLRLHPAAAARFELASVARFVDGSDAGPIPADRICASASMAALEAFQVLLRPRSP